MMPQDHNQGSKAHTPEHQRKRGLPTSCKQEPPAHPKEHKQNAFPNPPDCSTNPTTNPPSRLESPLTNGPITRSRGNDVSNNRCPFALWSNSDYKSKRGVSGHKIPVKPATVNNSPPKTPTSNSLTTNPNPYYAWYSYTAAQVKKGARPDETPVKLPTVVEGSSAIGSITMADKDSASHRHDSCAEKSTKKSCPDASGSKDKPTKKKWSSVFKRVCFTRRLVWSKKPASSK